MTSRLALRCVALVCIAGYALLRFGDPSYRDILDDVDLAVHEAGHVLFRGLGEPAYTAGTVGGSLLQVVVPLTFSGYFLRATQGFAAAVVMGWAGASLLDVAHYIGDARAQSLPLLGGENAVHDWWFLLTAWDLPARDLAIARGVEVAAAAAFAAAVAGGFACAAGQAPPAATSGD